MRTSSHARAFEGHELSTTVVEAIAEHEGIDPIDLDVPLAAVVDTDALDRLFSRATGSTVGNLVFRYGACEVSIDGSGDVRVTTAAEPTDG